jgi:16S rRNA G966 N2-methylase RsmD
MRYSVAVWGVSDSVRSAAFTAQRQETWCLDLLTGSTTVAAATFEAISRTG